MTNQNKRFINYCIVRFNYEIKKYDEEYALYEASRYVCYPECQNNNVFDFVDILFLLFISQIEIKIGIKQGLNVLLRILFNKNIIYLSSENQNILPPIYSTVAIMLGKLKLFDQCINIADKGIDYCIKYSLNQSLTRLYYSKAIAFKMINEVNKAEYYAALCFSNVISRNNKNEIKLFHDLLKDDFQKDPFLFIQSQKDDILN